MIGKLRNMTSIYLLNGDKVLLLYRQGGRVVNDVWTGSAGDFFANLKEGVSDNMVSNEGTLRWFSVKEVNNLEMPYTAGYVMRHYCTIGKFSDKIYAGIADENDVKFFDLPEF